MKILVKALLAGVLAAVIFKCCALDIQVNEQQEIIKTQSRIISKMLNTMELTLESLGVPDERPIQNYCETKECFGFTKGML